MLNKTHLANFTAVYFKDGDFWVGFIEEISGVNSQGRTLKELKENLLEALQLVIKTNRELSRKTIGRRKVVKENLNFALS